MNWIYIARIRRVNARIWELESPYATSYVWIMVPYLLFCTVSEIWQIIDPVFALDKSCFSFLRKFGFDKLLRRSLHHMTHRIFLYLEPFRLASRIWQSDRQTRSEDISRFTTLRGRTKTLQTSCCEHSRRFFQCSARSASGTAFTA